MRSIALLALLLGLAVCPLAAAAPPADCRSSSAAGITADQPVVPSCRDTNLTQRRPGFWILDDAAAEPGRDAADPQPTVLRADRTASSGGAACTRYPLPVVVGGQPLQATIVACPQADGSWLVTQYTPGLPPQVYTGPAPPEPATFAGDDYGYPESYADWAGWPWFSGFAPAVVRGRKFHDFRRPFDHRASAAFDHRSPAAFEQRSDHVFAHGVAHGFGHAGGVAGAAGMHR
jgi:hypothetical protein